MKIKDREISHKTEPLIIAEIGINHGGDLNLAKNMVDLAAKAGCEIIKHQTHFVEDEMTEEAKSIFPPNAEKSIWAVIDECSLSKDDEIKLKKYTENKGMIYFSTPFSRSAADFLNDIGVPAFKIGSGESDNLPLIEHICKFGKPIIMSTGMQSIATIKKSVKIMEDSQIEYALLECTNLYPSPPEIISLKGVLELKKEFPNAIIGFSDHSIGPIIALSSVALGACIIERHFTDSRYRKGPDISCSMDPAELKFIIERSKEVFIAAKNPKQRSTAEESVYKFARSSIVADKDLSNGDIIIKESIWARRPGNGEIPGNEYYNLLGKRLKKDIKRNQQLKWEDFS
jgi:sialic acid synthase SpsE